MNLLRLQPGQIIALNDFPLHNQHVFKIFFRIYQKKCGRVIPPVPVIHKRLVLPYLDSGLKQKFDRFCKRNPRASYFLLDGSHRTTAATLTRSKISALVLKANKSIIEAKKLAKTGELFHFYLKNTIAGVVKELVSHFRKKPYFQTIEQKTKKLLGKKAIPRYAAEYYKTIS